MARIVGSLAREGIPMQNSFWKIVSVVGVIGIGSLVVLEVQQQLSVTPPAQTAAPPPESNTGDVQNALLTSSELDDVLQQDRDFGTLSSTPAADDNQSANAPRFDVDEPEFETVAADGTPFYEGDSIAIPSIESDSGVRREALIPEGNPFARLDAAQTVTAGYQTDSESGSTTQESGIQPVVFQDSQPFSADASTGADVDTGPTFDDDQNSSTATEAGFDFRAIESENEPAAPKPSSESRSEPLLFFGDDSENPDPTEKPEDLNPGRGDSPTPSFDPFPELDADVTPDADKLRPVDSTNTLRGEQPAESESDEVVPLFDFMNGDAVESTNPVSPRPDSTNNPAGSSAALETSFSGDVLPFVEDEAASESGNAPLFQPDAEPDSASSIPEFRTDSPQTDREFSADGLPATPFSPGSDDGPTSVRPTGDLLSGEADLRPESDVKTVSGIMRPHVTLRKEAPENATVGIPLDYIIVVSNDGQSAAYDVVVEDEVTTGARLVGARPRADFDEQTRHLIWKFDTLAPGDSQRIQVQVTPTGEGKLDGVATVRFKTQVKATTLITAPKLVLELTGPPEVRMGDEVKYRYVVTNQGTGEARDVIVRSVLPSGLAHPEGNDLEYEILNLAPEESREVVLTLVGAEPGDHRTVAEVSARGGAKDQAELAISIIGAQLRVDRMGPQRRFVGRSATYENIVKNDTNFEARDAQVVEQIPIGMQFVSSSDQGDYNPQDRSVTWHIQRLTPGEQKSLKIELTALSVGSQQSVVTVVENSGFRDQAVAVTAVEDLHNVSADISRLDGPKQVGEMFGFSITIDNRGTGDATDVELVVEVPPELDVVGAGSAELRAGLVAGEQGRIVPKVVRYSRIIRIQPQQQKEFELKLKGLAPVRNALVKAQVRYKQLEEPLIISESVTIYRDDI